VKKARLLFAVAMASGFGVLSVLMIKFPDRIGPAAIFLFPGAVLAMVTSGNVHNFNLWVIALGNFVFYFGTAYLLWGIWERHARNPDSHNNGGPLDHT
jgi:predicted tellurium resistance membrane protein TerC